MTVQGSTRRSAEASRWWQAQLRDWPMEQRRQLVARLRVNPIRAAAAAALERHEPTEPVTMRMRNHEGKIVEVMVAARRVSDSRLWDSLSPDEEWAALQIREGFAAIDRGMGVRRPSIMQPVSGGSGGVNHTTLVDNYIRWGRRCTEQRIDHSACMDVLGYGRSCRETDRARRRRNGYTREQLANGLACFLVMMGRPTRVEAA